MGGRGGEGLENHCVYTSKCELPPPSWRNQVYDDDADIFRRPFSFSIRRDNNFTITFS